MTLPLISSSPAYSEASQIIGTVNALIQALNSAVNITPAVSSGVNLVTLQAGASGSPAIIGIGGPAFESNANLVIGAAGSGDVAIGGTGTGVAGAALTVDGLAANVNGLTVVGSTTGGGLATISATGSDTNIAVYIGGKGTGDVAIGGAGSSLGAALTVDGLAANVNGLTITGSVTAGTAATIACAGSDSLINLVLTTKGGGGLVAGVSSMFAAPQTVAPSLGTAFPAGSSTQPRRFLRLADPTGLALFIPCF